MKNFLKRFKKYETAKNSYAETKAREYVYKYLKELQRHFDLSDKKMRMILYGIYKDTSPTSRFIKLMKKKISMIKSKYMIKRSNYGT